MRTFKLISLILCLTASFAVNAQNYSFISGQDLHDALSQESMMLKGYFLGVTDALKGLEGDGCFVVPLAADADAQMIESYISYWRKGSIPERAVLAITEAMSEIYPCAGKD